SDHLRALEEAGLIERELDQADRRQFKIWLTDAGRDAVRRTTPNHVRHLNALVAALDRDEIEQLKNLLERLHRALRSQAQENSCHS
ncbi:MAG: winged helix-turn-helix transcriptional regulator, partial [Caldilineaceae bacterium]|nr:winged helix-turn-helix transcriptional regulator [Caldilineaceae bacterium]